MDPRGSHRARPRGRPQDGRLSEERLRFCEGILAGKSLRLAYEESGFLARGKDAATNGRQLLKEPEIQFYLAARRMELRERTDVEAKRVIQEMAAIAFFDPLELVMEKLEGPEDIAKLPEHVRRVISGWKYDRKGRFIVEFGNKLTALDQLARVFGLYQKGWTNEQARDASRLLSTAFWRFVISLHAARGISVGEAYKEAKSDPEAVEAWARSRGLLPSGDPIVAEA